LPLGEAAWGEGKHTNPDPNSPLLFAPSEGVNSYLIFAPSDGVNSYLLYAPSEGVKSYLLFWGITD
jgi:hypothetical protein